MICRMLCVVYICFACDVNCKVQVSNWSVEFKYDWIIWLSLSVFCRRVCVQQLQCIVVESQDLRVCHLKSSWNYMSWWNVKLCKLWTLSSLRCVFPLRVVRKVWWQICILWCNSIHIYLGVVFRCTSCLSVCTWMNSWSISVAVSAEETFSMMRCILSVFGFCAEHESEFVCHKCIVDALWVSKFVSLFSVFRNILWLFDHSLERKEGSSVELCVRLLWQPLETKRA